MPSLRGHVIKLATDKPELRSHLVPLLRDAAQTSKEAGKMLMQVSLWGSRVEFSVFPPDGGAFRSGLTLPKITAAAKFTRTQAALAVKALEAAGFGEGVLDPDLGNPYIKAHAKRGAVYLGVRVDFKDRGGNFTSEDEQKIAKILSGLKWEMK